MPVTRVFMRGTLVLGIAAAVWGVAGSPSGARVPWSERHVSGVRVSHRASIARHAHRHHHHHRRRQTHPATVRLAWTNPRNGAEVSGRLNESAHNCVVSARSRVGIDHVTFYRDGAVLNTERSAPYSCIWNTTATVDGSAHTLKAVADNELGRTASASIRVTVDNVDARPPRTRIPSGPSGTVGSDSASFSFSSSEWASSFECR